MKIKINEIIVNDRMREANQEKVIGLSESIKDIGLLQPICINEQNILVAGLHRLEACKLLEYDEIECNVLNFEDGNKQRLAEIDENLIRNDLTAKELSDWLIERKRVYELIYPETKKGASGGWHNNKGINIENAESALSSESFVENTSKAMGKSKRVVSELLQIGKNITPEANAMIKGTDLENEKTNLLEISKHTADEQIEIVTKKKEAPDKSVKEIISEVKESNQFKKEVTVSSDEEENKLIERLRSGETVVLNYLTHKKAMQVAKNLNKYREVGRTSDLGNPYKIDIDGDRDWVCDGYKEYFKYKVSLHKRLPNLKGCALVCYCAPLRCHADYLKELVDNIK